MDVSGVLPEGVWLEYRDEKILRPIDYKKISFRCWKCHFHGHLVRECPMNKVEELTKEGNGKEKDGFVHPNPRNRVTR